MAYRLVDTHAHLDEMGDTAQVIDEARSANLIAIIAVGSDYESNRKILELARTYKDFVYPALGYHPYSIKDTEIELNLQFIKDNLDKAVAVGEIGLDYHKRVRANADKDLQRYVLRELLKIAATRQKPVLIHSRYAWRDALNLVSETPLEKVVFHWYAGTSSVLRDIVAHRYYISATPAVEYHAEHRRAVKEVPLDRLLLETDSPVVYRRDTEFEFESRPAHVVRVLKGISSLTGMDEAQIAQVTTGNALRFFGL